MHELNLLENLTFALSFAFVGGLLVQRLKMPTIVGYLIAGIAMGPSTPGYVGDPKTIGALAELGIVFLMFGVGLHFSFNDLWKVRDTAIVGTLGQMVTMTALGYLLGRYWGWTHEAAAVLGLALSIASTIVMLKGFMDLGWLNTIHSKVATGWRVMEDILAVLILLIMPNLANVSAAMDWRSLGIALLTAIGFLVFMAFAGTRLLPWLLIRVAHTRSRELFILAILALSLGIAVAASELFGVSLALGAFVAGAVVSESPLSHRITSDLLPFREAFSVLFFVSIGMMVDPGYVAANWQQVLSLAAVVIVGKFLVSAAWALRSPQSARTALIVAAGSSQIGEFSFILGQAGVSLGFFDQGQYSLILASAIVSIILNPLVLRSVDPLQKLLRSLPWLWRVLDRHSQPKAPLDAHLTHHVVVVGYGRVGSHVADILGELKIPYLVIDSRISRVERLSKRGVPTLLGDTANSDILCHADLPHARLLVITLPEEAATELTVAAARDLAPQLPIIARAATRVGVKRLTALGAQLVIHPELEGSLQVLRHTLLQLGFPLQEVRRFADSVRKDTYDARTLSDGEHAILSDLLDTADLIDITWIKLPPDSKLLGVTLKQTSLRSSTGANLVAVLREGQLLVNPTADTEFRQGDRLGLLGDAEQIARAQALFASSPPDESPTVSNPLDSVVP